MKQKNWLIWAALAVVVFASCSKKEGTEPAPTPPRIDTSTTSVSYMQLARQTHNFITSNLMTPYGSYRVNTTTKVNEVHQWYVTSQIYADAAMIEAGDTSLSPYMNKTFMWMENMWDRTNGGYYSFCRPDGTGASGDKYIDDNSLSGVIYLEAAEVAWPSMKQAYINKAKACGDWLINSGMWDNTAGGGFWWNTAYGGKATQTNGLCLQLFLRLYQTTGQTIYKDWAIKVNDWLQAKMYEPATGLFIWKWDGANAATRYSDKFTYDNAIMIEAYMLYSKIMNDASYLQKAQAIATAMTTTLWHPLHKGFIFVTDPSQTRVNPAWCGWGSQSFIRLYETDRNANWLNYAQQNINALNKACRNTTNFGYYFFANFDGSSRSPEYEGVDQAWMQRVQALMSKHR